MPLGSSMVTKAAHQRARRMNSESTRRKWIRYVVSLLKSLKSRLRISGTARRIVRSDAETVCELALARGQRFWEACDGVAVLDVCANG